MSMPPENSSPYKGLVPYTEQDAQFFFGRESEIEIIEANLVASRLTILYGASGVGKSSVLRAGVAHRLLKTLEENIRDQGTPEFLIIVFSLWRDEPTTSLINYINEAVVLTCKDQSVQIIEEQSSLIEVIQSWTQRFNIDFLIILDQFEEYFLYHPEEDTCSFDTEFPRVVNNPNLRANFLVSIREDGLAKLDRFKGRIANLFDNYLRLEYLDFKSGRDAITKPIEQFNRVQGAKLPVTIEPALIDAVLEQVKTGELIIGDVGRGVAKESINKEQVETPYLQLVMSRLWSEELGRNSLVLRQETLHRLGGAQRIVSRHLDRVMKRFRITDRAAAATFFQYLVTPSGSKIAYPVSDLITISRRSKAEVERILKVLENERILRYIPPPIHQPGFVRYEIYHDVLGRSILDWRSRFLRIQKIARVITDIGVYMLWSLFSVIVVAFESDLTILLCGFFLPTIALLLYVFYFRKRFKLFTGI